MSARERQRVLWLLRAGSTGLPVGIALCTVGHVQTGAVFTLGGAVALVLGLHRFGRLGP